MKKEDIKKLRETLGLSTQIFADMIGVTRMTINRWESGKTKPHEVYIRIMQQKIQEPQNGNKHTR